MGKAGKAKGKKKRRQKVVEELDTSIPRSFVIGRDVPPPVQQLVADMRMIMSPYTALKLKVSKKNVLKDFVAMAGPLGVSHLLSFTKTSVGTNLRLARLPRGPTLTFRVPSYALAKDVASCLSKPKSPGQQLLTPPLLVLNNFAGEDVATKLLSTTFQSMFPSIDVSTVELGALKRVVLIHRDSDGEMYLRHYELSVKPAGVSKSVKSLLKPEVPDLSKFKDVSEFVLRGGEGYESDASDMGDSNKVELAQTLKVEEGFCGGEVLYHSHISKSEADVAAMKKKREKAAQLKASRKAEQARNVEKKAAERAANRERSIAGHNAKHGKGPEESKKGAAVGERSRGDSGVLREDSGTEDEYDAHAAVLSSDDDAEWYRKEVGEEPEAGLFSKYRPKQGSQSGGRDNGSSRKAGKGHEKERSGTGSKKGSYFSGPQTKRKRQDNGGAASTKAKKSRQKK